MIDKNYLVFINSIFAQKNKIQITHQEKGISG